MHNGDGKKAQRGSSEHQKNKQTGGKIASNREGCKMMQTEVKSYQPHVCIQGNERMSNNSYLSGAHARGGG